MNDEKIPMQLLLEDAAAESAGKVDQGPKSTPAEQTVQKGAGRKGRWPESRKIKCICATCGKEMLKMKSLVDGKQRVFCDRKCAFPLTIEQRFLKYVAAPGEGECWEWSGYCNSTGYGKFKLTNGESAFASRVCYSLFVGEIPDGKFVLHKCDNPPCVNPSHLFLGDNASNMLDMKQKGRRLNIYCGTDQHNAKLSDDRVVEMRRRNAIGTSVEALALEFGVTKSTARKAIFGITWKHVK